jgi:hypothetical protein
MRFSPTGVAEWPASWYGQRTGVTSDYKPRPADNKLLSR